MPYLCGTVGIAASFQMSFMLYFCGLAATSADYPDVSATSAVFARIALGCQRKVEMIAFIAWQIEQEMKAQNMNKTTLSSAAAVPGKKLEGGIAGGVMVILFEESMRRISAIA